MPRVSVVIPVYNAAEYVTAALRSVSNQTCRDFEIICVEDGSADASLERLNDYAKREPRLKVISRPNTGICGAHNDGIDQATGELIARMDADDLSTPDRFAKQIAYLDAHPDCVALGAQVIEIDPHGLPITRGYQPCDHASIERLLLQGVGEVVRHPVVMMRADAVRAAGCYREQYKLVEDIDLFLRMALRGKLANLPDVLLRYRMHGKSTTLTKSLTQARLMIELMTESHRDRGHEPPQELIDHFAGFQPPEKQPNFKPWQLHDYWSWRGLRQGYRWYPLLQALSAIRAAPRQRKPYQTCMSVLRRWVYWPDRPRPTLKQTGGAA